MADELESALAREAQLRERLRVFGRIQEGLGRLREVGSVEAMIQRAPAEVARACDLDRIAIYRISDGVMMAEAFHVEGDPAMGADHPEAQQASVDLLDHERSRYV